MSDEETQDKRPKKYIETILTINEYNHLVISGLRDQVLVRAGFDSNCITQMEMMPGKLIKLYQNRPEPDDTESELQKGKKEKEKDINYDLPPEEERKMEPNKPYYSPYQNKIINPPPSIDPLKVFTLNDIE